MTVYAASEFENKIYTFSGSLTFPNLTLIAAVYSYQPVPVAVKSRKNITPEYFILYEAYPNPFNPSTTIEFGLPHAGFVTLKVYNVLGEGVATIIAGDHAAGMFKSTWDASGLPSGVYFYRLTAGEYVQTKKIVLVR
jgi:hypothetical protein